MKKGLLQLLLCLCLVLLVILIPSVHAEGNIEITRQPQNFVFPEDAVAYWTVEASGDSLSYDWYIVYNGVAYQTSKSFSEAHPWQDGVTGDGYGQNETGNSFFINGIGEALDGAQIYCVISDGTQSVTSADATISVGSTAYPPEIMVPAYVNIHQDEVLKLACKATTGENDSIQAYLWYETETGELRDIVAIGAKEGYAEENSILVCDTTQVGTRYYVCAVKTENGGFAYSSVIPVTVTEVDTSQSVPPDTPESSYVPDTTPVLSDNTEQANTESASPETDGKNSENPAEQKSEASDTHPISEWGIVLIALAGVGIGAVIGAGIAKRK